jgi:hypothetical protein
LFALPFVKILWDLFYTRVPENSVIYAGYDPLTAPAHGNMVSIGAGFSEFGPALNLAMFEVTAANGKRYTLGVADYLFALVSKYLGHNMPYLVLTGALVVSLFLLSRRVLVAKRFENERRSYRLKDRTLDRLKCGGREVDLYASAHFEGTPFTGGILKPYICFPENAYRSLSDDQREAVIQHELGHVRQWDLLGTWFVKVMGDLFWFVPFYRVLSRKIDCLREILADQYAVSSGVAREALASSLLALESSKMGSSEFVIYSAFFREKKLLKIRVEKLLGADQGKRSRFGWDWPWIKIPATALVVSTVLFATLGGNHSAVTTPGFPPGLQAVIHHVQHFFQMLKGS